MTIDDLCAVLIGEEFNLNITVGTMRNGGAIDRAFAVVAHYSAPSIWRESEVYKLSLVPLNEVDDYLADVPGTRRIA